MKKLGMFIAVALAAACVLAQQEGPRRGKHGGRHQRGERPPAGERPHAGPMMHAPGAWVPRMLSTKENLAKIGVTDEALSAKLLGEFKPLKEQGDQLEQKIRDISREQAMLMRALVKDKSADPKAVMDKIDEVAKLRAEQGRLSVKALVVLRDNLTPEQLEKAREFIQERGRMRGRMRGGMGEPPPDGSAPRDKPFAPGK